MVMMEMIGFVKVSLHLFNADQPEISTHPVSTVITEGSDLLITCNATGNPTPSVSWTKDGSLINASRDPRISFGSDTPCTVRRLLQHTFLWC